MEVIFPKPIPQDFADKLLKVYNTIRKHVDELNATKIYLFGSVARGDYNELSDLDILVITAESATEASVIIESLDVRDDVEYPHVDVVVRSEKSLKSDKFLFNTFVEKDGILLWER